MVYSENLSPPIAEPLEGKDASKILTPEDSWTDERALKIVRSDWAYAESFRVNAHDWRYRNADELYLGWYPQRYWDGTRIPRSSLGQYVIFQQIQAMLAKTVPPVTSFDNMHFYAEQPGDDKTDDYVLAWSELIKNQLMETKFRANVQRALQSLKQYGNGILEVGFENYTEEYVTFEKRMVPTKFGPLQPGMLGQAPMPSMMGNGAGMPPMGNGNGMPSGMGQGGLPPGMVPTQTEEKFSRKVIKETKTRPYVRYVSIKDFYVDPNCESNVLQDAGYVIKRVYMRAEQIKALKGQDGFKIPDDDYLSRISKAKSTSNQDVTKQAVELFRYTNWSPSVDYSSDPSQKRIAIVEYTTRDRKIWWMQGGDEQQSIIYNQKNRYGCINYWSAPYAEVMDRWHGLAVADVGEGEQRLQASIINARIDELALSLHKPMLKRRGVTIPQYQLKVRPGVVVETESPEQDIKTMEVDNITAQAYVEVDASNNRVQKTTGMTDLAALGTASPGGNSANRTAAGVNTQSGATDTRMFYMVGTIEDLLIEPVLNAVIRFNRKFMDMKTASNWLKLDPRFQKLDPVKVMNCRVIGEMRGSIRMAARSGFLQIFPVLAQTVLNPELLTLVGQQQQKALNAVELVRRLDDAINYSGREPLLIDMTPEQIKAQQQPPPQEMLKAQGQKAQQDSDEKIVNNRIIADLFKTLIKSGMAAHAQHGELDDNYAIEMAKLLLSAHTAQQTGDDDSGGAGEDSQAG
jgi:hypothetical protein